MKISDQFQTELGTFAKMGTDIGLRGEELSRFISEQQTIARDQRKLNREERQEKLEREERELIRQHEREENKLDRERRDLELARIGAENNFGFRSNFVSFNVPRPLPLDDGEDLISYFIRFVRPAELNKWEKDRDYAPQLGSLLIWENFNCIRVLTSTYYKRLRFA